MKEENLVHARFPQKWNNFIQDAPVVKEGKLACWNDVVRDALVLLEDGKLARASYPPCWNDVIHDVIVIGGKLAH